MNEFYDRYRTLCNIGFILVLFGLYHFILLFRSGEVLGVVEDYCVEISVTVDRAGITRAYNRSIVPSCGFDVRHHLEWECDQRDSNFICIRGHYEDEYDYSIIRWNHHQTIDSTFWRNKHPPPIQVNLPNKNYVIKKTQRKHYIVVKYKERIKKFLVNEETFRSKAYISTPIRIRVRKRNNNILNIIQ